MPPQQSHRYTVCDGYAHLVKRPCSLHEAYVPGPNVARGAEGDNDSSSRGGHRRGLAESNSCTAPKKMEPWVPRAGPVATYTPKREPGPYIVAASHKRPVPLNACSHARLPRDVHVTRHDQDAVVCHLNSKFCPEVQAATKTGNASDLLYTIVSSFCVLQGSPHVFLDFLALGIVAFSLLLPCRNPHSTPAMPTYNH